MYLGEEFIPGLHHGCSCHVTFISKVISSLAFHGRQLDLLEEDHVTNKYLHWIGDLRLGPFDELSLSSSTSCRNLTETCSNVHPPIWTMICLNTMIKFFEAQLGWFSFKCSCWYNSCNPEGSVYPNSCIVMFRTKGISLLYRQWNGSGLSNQPWKNCNDSWPKSWQNIVHIKTK